MQTSQPDMGSRLGLRLVIVSFVGLFLQLMFIRWVPSNVRVVTYYANLILISSFLGIGMGAMISGRTRRQLPWFGFLLAGFLYLIRSLGSDPLPGTETEVRGYSQGENLSNYAALLAIFVANSCLFVPLGDEIGKLFRSLPPLKAYSFDLIGSLLGTVCFGIFAFRFFSPTVGMLVAVALIVMASGIMGPLKDRTFAIVSGGTAALAVVLLTASHGLWSPYYFITTEQLKSIEQLVKKEMRWPVPTEPPAELHAMSNPPIYVVRANQDFYQFHGTIDGQRYTSESGIAEFVAWLRNQFLLPYSITGRPKRVLIVGAGGGMDVEGALLSGADHVVAVEVDPLIVKLSKKYNASNVYGNDRVTVRVDDARAFLQRDNGLYDVIAFGYLDASALFSNMSNIRLDGFVYTVESLARAYDLVSEGGVLVLSFATGEGTWLPTKLYQMITTATGGPPLVYADRSKRIFIKPKGDHAIPPSEFGPLKLIETVPHMEVPMATDDWPYLYLSKKTIPRDYLVVIGALLGLSVLGVIVLKPPGMGIEGMHFLLLGFGFLLLETSSIVRCSLYFGTTWLVTTIVIAGILTMVLAANLIVLRFRPQGQFWYVFVFASLLLIYFMPSSKILELPIFLRLAWTLLVVPLPIFFAGIIFSTSFAQATNTAAMFGANLIGAMLGGFFEYLGMVTGHGALLLFVFVAYAASWACRRTV